jgi:SAM-dependent methyltransferase
MPTLAGPAAGPLPPASTPSPSAGERPIPPVGRGLRRSVRMFRAFLVEQTDPDLFYRTQAADTLAQVERHLDVRGRVVLDVGGGGGYFTEAFRQAGARCVLVEPEAGSAVTPLSSDGSRRHHQEAVRPGRLAPGATVAGDGHRLPFPDGSADLAFSSNVLEHVPDASRFLAEMVRVTRPGGLIYLSYTAWLSPWGGHETSPWHFLGGRRAARRYQRRHGRPPGNLYGTSLFPQHVGPVLRLVRARPDVEIVEAGPRYYPPWLAWLIRVPGVRELATWNLLLILRRRAP